MPTAVVSWTLPTTKENGNPLPVTDIVGVDVSLSTDSGQTFILLDTVPSGVPQEYSILDLANGEYIVRLRVVSVDGKSVPVNTQFAVVASAPNPVTNVQVNLT